MRFLILRTVVTSVLFGFSVTVLAESFSEEDDLALVYGDKSSISIVTGKRQNIQQAPAVATVITAEDIAAIGATKLDDVLETIPGMHVSRASIRYAPLYIMRGIGGGNQTSPQILMLQNGIPMTTMYNGDRGSAWITVPLENIARIEVIRGPGSALYGADAYSGVINIITKTSQDISGGRFGVRVGSFNTQDIWGQYGGEWGSVNVASYLSVGRTDGISNSIAYKGQMPGPVNTGYDSVDGNLDFSKDKWRMRASYKLRDNLQTGAGISSALDPGSLGKAENITGDLSWNDPDFSENWGFDATASVLHYVFTYPTNIMLRPPGTVIGGVAFPNGLIGGPNQWERQFRFSTNAAYTGIEKHNVRVGVGHDILDLYKTRTIKNYMLNAAGVPVSPGPVLDYTAIQPHILPNLRKVDYIYAQDEWNIMSDWALTAGLRHDQYSDFGATTNPRLALVWDASIDLTVKLLYGTAFRAPSFNEQYGRNPVANGNPFLQPETIKTFEAAMSWKSSQNTRVNLNLFDSSMKNIIRLVPNIAPTPGSTYANADVQHGQGMELEGVWDFSRTLHLTGNYAYQKTIDATTNQDAGYAPRHHLYARADKSVYGSWLFSLQVDWVADRMRAFGDARPRIADYQTVDIALRSNAGKNQWELSTAIRNLFNTDVREPSIGSTAGSLIPNDLPMASRSIYFQAVYTL